MAETFTGEVRNGVVVFEGGASPPRDGTRVRVVVIDTEQALAQLSRDLLEIAGTAQCLPPDMAEQHDHYLRGLPRR